MTASTYFKMIVITLLAIHLTGVAAAETPLISGPGDEAPAGLNQYGQFVGSWRCSGTFLDGEGNWQDAPGRPRWVWHYILDGRAIQDVWLPDPESSPPGAAKGTNLRVYNAEKDEWDMVWTTETLEGFQRFSARMVDGHIVMHGDIPAGARPAHKARITFHNISSGHFDWQYEASALNDGQQWQKFSTLSCDREVD